MEVVYPTVALPATADYVLSVIQDEHRQGCQWDPEADPEAVLSYDSTVSEWRDACDLVSWRSLGGALNDMWGIRCSDAEWRAVLEPARRRTLRDVCGLIAERAVQPRIRPATVLGQECYPAGAFLTVRSLLHTAGASADGIAPSTALAPYTRQHLDVFLGPVSRLAPGVLPLVKIHEPIDVAAAVGFVVAAAAGVACLVAGTMTDLWPLTLVGAALFVLSWAVGRVTSDYSPASVEFGDLQTFRDLALLMAERLPERAE